MVFDRYANLKQNVPHVKRDAKTRIKDSLIKALKIFAEGTDSSFREAVLARKKKRVSKKNDG